MHEPLTVTFTDDKWLPVTRDGLDYELHYKFVPTGFVGEPEELHETKGGTVHVGISRTLSAMWGLQGDPLRNVLFEFAKRHVRAKAEDAALGGRSEIQLTSRTAPTPCPFDPSRIRRVLNEPFQLEGAKSNPMAAAEPSSLPSLIIDLRDSINALFGEHFGGRLLGLPQERHVVELFRRCEDHEGFAYRVASIGGLATAIETDTLRKNLRESGKRKRDAARKKKHGQSEEPLKPIDLLGAFLRKHYPADQVEPIMNSIKNFNNLRRMYPIHTDRAGGVLPAHQFLDIGYPVKDHVAAGTKLLEAYRDTLERLLALLKTTPPEGAV